jgi:hypothetical protein
VAILGLPIDNFYGPNGVVETQPAHQGVKSMLWGLAVILLVLWVLGFAVFHVAGGLIHILIVIAVIVFIYQFVTGRRG